MIDLQKSGNNSLLTAGKNALSAVTFNAPGIGDTDPVTNPGSYRAYNFDTQGDVIHQSGGYKLGQSVTLAVGPSRSQELGDFIKGWGASRSGLRAAIITGAGNFAHDLLAAHTIKNFWGANNLYNNSPGYFNSNPGQAADTAALWFQLYGGSGVSGTGGLNLTGNNITLSDSGGNTITFSAGRVPGRAAHLGKSGQTARCRCFIDLDSVGGAPSRLLMRLDVRGQNIRSTPGDLLP
jgi:hypothetical protein